jgi:hypothetical protein
VGVGHDLEQAIRFAIDQGAGHRVEAFADFARSDSIGSSPPRMALNAARQSSVAGALAAASGTSGSTPSVCVVRSLEAFMLMRSFMLAPRSDSARANRPESLRGLVEPKPWSTH